MVLFLGYGVNAQTLSTDTFNSANTNMPLVGNSFDVPIDVTSIGEIFTFTVYFEYDNAVLTWDGTFTNGLVPNITVTQHAEGVLKIIASGAFPDGETVPDGVLLDLQFSYLGGFSDLSFWTIDNNSPYCKIVRTTFLVFDFTDTDVTNGSVGEYIISGGDWNTASNWNSNAVPIASRDAFVVAGTETTIDAAAMCNNLTIEQGGQLTLNSTFDVDGDFTIESDVAGSGSFINNGTLTVTGTSSAECYVTNGTWHGIASPVSGETFASMYLGGSPEVWIKSYDEANNTYVGMFDTTQTIGDMEGWFTFVQTSGSPQTFSFEGPYRTGTVGGSMAYSNTGHNFVGNAFTSAIDWDAASGWTKTNMNNAIYVYNDGNWASYVGGNALNGGSRYIAMSQGFFVQANAAGASLTMDNDVCVHNGVGYLKSQNTEQEVVRLEIEDAGLVDEVLIVFRDGATEDYDGEFDAHKFFSFNADYPQIYSTANDFMSINALPLSAKESVAMDVRGKDGNSLTISATEGEDFEYLILKDAVTGIDVNLKEKSYTFVYDTEVTDRFTLYFSPLGVNDNSLSGDAVKIFAYDNNIQVVLKATDHANISVYNLLGQEVVTRSANANITSIPMNKSGYYLVKVSDGKSHSTQKVFIK